MHRIILWIFCLVCIQGGAFVAAAKDQTLHLSAKQREELGNPKYLHDDAIVMRDGTKYLGALDTMPHLRYVFGSMEFSLEEVSSIAFAPVEGSQHVQYVTRDGHTYIGRLDARTLPFRYLRDWGKSRHKISDEVKRIHADEIDFILLKSRGNYARPMIGYHFMSMVLRNGDRFPFLIDSYRINLESDGESFSILTKDISDIWVNGGMHGYLRSKGLDYTMFFSSIEDQKFKVRLGRNGQRFAIPWHMIERIKGDGGAMATASPYRFSNRVAPYDNMVMIPPGNFFLGSNLPPGSEGEHDIPLVGDNRTLSPFTIGQIIYEKNYAPTLERPAQLVRVDGFFIDKYEVTNAQYKRFINATGHPAPPHWIEGRVPLGMENHPVTHVSYHDAERYAEWSGKRLPTEVEWERAAKGITSAPYPYGGIYDPTLANTASKATRAVGSYEELIMRKTRLVTDFQRDVQDMSGNVAEWTASTYDPEQFSYNLDRGSKAEYSVVRGGGFVHGPETATTTYRAPMWKGAKNSYTGFRCVTDLVE